MLIMLSTGGIWNRYRRINPVRLHSQLPTPFSTLQHGISPNHPRSSPSAFNGLYGLCPSSGRLPYSGMANSMNGQTTIPSVVGPLGSSIQSIRLVTQALLSQKPWLHDPLVHEIPWRHDQECEILDLTSPTSNSKLAIGILRHDGLITPTPPVRRALDIVATALQKLGHEVLDWDPPSHERLLEISAKTWLFDGGADVHAAFALSGEPMASQIAMYHTLSREYTASEVAATNVELRALRTEYLAYWNSTAAKTTTGRPVDAVVAPVAPYPAARKDRYKYYGYTIWVNVLDYTSVVLPVTKADKSIDTIDGSYWPLNDVDKETFESCELTISGG